jgi:hypothetical protein
MSELVNWRKRELECTRMAADCMHWRATCRTPVCGRISLGWRWFGPTLRLENRTRIIERQADT